MIDNCTSSRAPSPCTDISLPLLHKSKLSEVLPDEFDAIERRGLKIAATNDEGLRDPSFVEFSGFLTCKI